MIENFMSNTKKLRFSILDPLRLIAALAVVFYHYSIYIEQSSPVFASIFKYGYLGVDFFFILSGFVIMASAQNRSAFEFALSRAIRIYPAFMLCLGFTLLVSYYLDSSLLFWKNIFWNAIILNDYVGIPNIDGVYWTLQAELKFYGCIFILLLSGAFVYWRYWLGIWLFAAISYYFYQQPYFMGWFINPGYSFYFIGGVCAYLLHQQPQNKYVYIVLFISMIFAFFSAQQQASDFMVHVNDGNRLVAALVVMLFYVFFILLAKGFFNIGKSPLLMLLGALSYPLYLIHNRAGKTIILNFIQNHNPYIVIGIVVLFLVVIALVVCLIERIFHKYLNLWSDQLITRARAIRRAT